MSVYSIVFATLPSSVQEDREARMVPIRAYERGVARWLLRLVSDEPVDAAEIEPYALKEVLSAMGGANPSYVAGMYAERYNTGSPTSVGALVGGSRAIANQFIRMEANKTERYGDETLDAVLATVIPACALREPTRVLLIPTRKNKRGLTPASMQELLSWGRTYDDPLNFPASPTKDEAAGWEISMLLDVERRACVIAAALAPAMRETAIPFCELLVQPPAYDAKSQFTVQDVIDRIVRTTHATPGWETEAPFQPVVIPLGGDEDSLTRLEGLQRIDKVNGRRVYDVACELRALFHAARHDSNAGCFRLLASFGTDKYPLYFNLVAGFGATPTLAAMLTALCEHMTAQVKAYKPGDRYLATIEGTAYPNEEEDMLKLPELVRAAQSKAASRAAKDYIAALLRATKRTAAGRVREKLKLIEQRIDGASAG